jgi:hypothetical protein
MLTKLEDFIFNRNNRNKVLYFIMITTFIIEISLSQAMKNNANQVIGLFACNRDKIISIAYASVNCTSF